MVNSTFLGANSVKSAFSGGLGGRGRRRDARQREQGAGARREAERARHEGRGPGGGLQLVRHERQARPQEDVVGEPQDEAHHRRRPPRHPHRHHHHHRRQGETSNSILWCQIVNGNFEKFHFSKKMINTFNVSLSCNITLRGELCSHNYPSLNLIQVSGGGGGGSSGGGGTTNAPALESGAEASDAGATG